MLTLQPSQFVEFLPGETKPARFVVNGDSWVFRYPKGAGRQLRLASELVGYRVASWLEVSVPFFCLAQTSQALEPTSSSAGIPAAIGTATVWLERVRYPDFERKEKDPFPKADTYLRAAAAARVADTWTMNFDRPRCGNTAVRGADEAPEVYFLDFDQAFLAKCKEGSKRPHWVDAGFQPEMLNNRELLSGVLTPTGAERPEHFHPAVELLRSISVAEVGQAVRDIPAQWGIDDSDRHLWAERLLARRQIVLDILRANHLAL